MRTQETADVTDRIRVLSDAVREVASDLGITLEEIRCILGHGDSEQIPDHRDGRLIGGSRQELDRAASLVLVHRALLSLVGGDRDLARAWIGSPNKAFANQAPKTILLQDGGLMAVLDYLNSGCLSR